MNKKSFYRGFGVGVLFATIILGISCMIRTSDSFVKSRAKELGMVYEKNDENAISYEAKSSKEPADGEKKGESESKGETAEPTKKPKGTKEPVATPAVTPNPTENPAPTPKPTKKPAKSPKKQPSVKQLVIHAGDWSSDVSKKLEELGVVRSAKEFDKYLNDYGYSASISAGTYIVSEGDSFEELAKKITGR